MAVLPPPQPRPEPLFPGPLTDEALRALFEGAADFVARQIAVPGGMIGLYFIDGLVSGSDISEYVIGPMVQMILVFLIVVVLFKNMDCRWTERRRPIKNRTERRAGA